MPLRNNPIQLKRTCDLPEAHEDFIIFQMNYKDVEELCPQSHSIGQYCGVILEKAYANSKE